jgi:type II secretory pathway component GspD/PulD (secretin)
MIKGRFLIALITPMCMFASNANAQTDPPARQIMIKAIFSEVTHDDSLQAAKFFAALDRKPQALSQPTTMPSSSWSAVAATREMTAAFQKLADKGKGEILSRPYVLAMDNHLSTLTVGLTEKNSAPNFPGDAGYLIDLIPHVTADGKIIMDVSMTVHRAGDPEPNPPDQTAPVFPTRSAQVRVAVESGHLIILHGFAHQHEVTTIGKIPVVGDLPLFGALFTGKKTTQTNVEVVVIISPSLVNRTLP